MAASSISRRMEDCIKAFMSNDFENALIHYFPALDKTAKKRRNVGVGERIRTFLDDELEIITHVAVRNIIRIECNNLTFPQAIYKFGRTPIAHEGELDPRIRFDNRYGLSIGDTWNLPPSFIAGMILSVVIAPENSSEIFEGDYQFSIHGQVFELSKLWGQRQQIRNWINAQYGRNVFIERPNL